MFWPPCFRSGVFNCRVGATGAIGGDPAGARARMRAVASITLRGKGTSAHFGAAKLTRRVKHVGTILSYPGGAGTMVSSSQSRASRDPLVHDLLHFLWQSRYFPFPAMRISLVLAIMNMRVCRAF